MAESFKEFVKKRIKKRINDILHGALSGEDKQYRSDDGFVRWARVENHIMQIIDDISIEPEPKPVDTEKKGYEIANFLNLQKNGKGRYFTVWGDKTETGLYVSMKRIIDGE